jgi:hypothetical protein
MILKVKVNNNTESAVNINQDSSFLISNKNDGYTIFHNNHDILPDAVWFRNKEKASDMLDFILRDYRDHKFEYILNVNWLLDTDRGIIVKGYNDSSSIQKNKEKIEKDNEKYKRIVNQNEELINNLEELKTKLFDSKENNNNPNGKPVPHPKKMLDVLNDELFNMKKRMWENAQKRRNNRK